MNCPKCGGVDDGWLFCPACGAALVEAAGAARWAAALRSGVRGANVAGFRVLGVDARLSIRGTTLGGVESTGTVTPFEVTGHEAHLWLGDVRWENGEREIRTLFRFPDSSPVYDSLVDRLRIPVEALPGGRIAVGLRQARVRAGGLLVVADATVSQLEDAAGVDVAEVLLRFGVERFGTRSALLEDRSPARSLLCAIAPASETLAPVAAYVLARLAPVSRRYDGVASDAAAHAVGV